MSGEAARRLEAGKAAIVRLGEGSARYTVLTAAAAATLRGVAPERVVVLYDQ